ncbi:ATP-binding cassette domain-containing protein [Chelativorans sp. ZYF759]|uniref:ABC transporter ATP-binding protein n=1 Tax=Chelativorans sp. ZYF759 TaxID=2692213 RepID=UPI00145EFC41|nr:ABC transporter ATP-binding protein [Chelativorans sp. ZYF759]NMG39297.1 ATP-binding cassette domain-containing protein [Chelativorans sp. ZYF759]
MAELRIENLAKTFKGGFQALSGISFDVADREAVFLLGPSGAGKTTTLRLVAGLELPSEGRITIDGKDVSGWQPRERNLAMVYDKHSLFPHMTVFENLAYPLRNRKLKDAEIRSRIGTVTETLQVSELLERYPSQLSGGQMQRVAIGRALVREANVYLLDEPISHLDAKLRARMRVEFKRLQRDYRATMLYVSHDQLEAMTMADRIVLINQGRVEQIAPPQELFDRPETLFAATFVGEPSMNVFEARLLQQDGGFGLSLGKSRIALDRDWFATGEPISPDRAYLAGIRPQHVTLADAGATGVNVVHGTVFAVETLGSRIIFDIEAEGTVVRVLTSTDTGRQYSHEIGTPIAFRVAPELIYLFEAQTGRTVRQAQFTDPAGQLENGFAPQGARRQ